MPEFKTEKVLNVTDNGVVINFKGAKVTIPLS